MTRLFVKIAVIIVPCFLIVAGFGLHNIVEHEVANADDELSMRVGSAAARVAVSLTKISNKTSSNADLDPWSDALPQELLNIMMADPAIRCVELWLDTQQQPIAAAPRGLGCKAEKNQGSKKIGLPVHLGESGDGQMLVLYDVDELFSLRSSSRDQAFGVLAGGLLIAIFSAAAAFRSVVERPVFALLDSIRKATTGHARHVNYPCKSDEMGEVIDAFNSMQIRLSTERKRVDNALGELKQIYDCTPALLCTLDRQARVTCASEHCLISFGLGPEAIIGSQLPLIVVNDADDAAKKHFSNMIAQGQNISDLPLRVRTVQGLMDVLLSAVYRDAGEQAQHLCVMTNVTELNRAQEQLQQQAMTDSLTGLPNRRSMMDTLSLAMQKKLDGCRRLAAVLFVDLDNFKSVNDSLGHEAGDHLLIEAANRLKACAGHTNIIARLGGDEFAVIVFEGCETPEAIAQAIIDATAAPFNLPGHVANLAASQVTASIGIARLVQDNLTPDDILRFADQAMYKAKFCGKGRYATFEPDKLPKIIDREFNDI